MRAEAIVVAALLVAMVAPMPPPDSNDKIGKEELPDEGRFGAPIGAPFRGPIRAFTPEP